MLKATLRKIPLAREVHRRVARPRGAPREMYPRGHFYSPLPDIEWVRANAERLLRKDVALGPSIDLREAEQEALLHQLATYLPEFDVPREAVPGARYYSQNRMFGVGSAFGLYAMLRHFQPKQVIEVGSGFTSALMLDVVDRYFEHGVTFDFIEPYPERLHSLLRPEDHERCRIHEVPVQEVPVSTFTRLRAGDFLFIDSSHVSRIGSDLNYLLFEVLPRLDAGVLVHFHDIFWPFEYPLSWLSQGRAWNEAYLLRAFLQYNRTFAIVQFNDYLGYRFADFDREQLPAIGEPGSSLWLRKV
jgi:predicted O-methyltransferase YrrM